jgi:hypothetical protein
MKKAVIVISLLLAASAGYAVQKSSTLTIAKTEKTFFKSCRQIGVRRWICGNDEYSIFSSRRACENSCN